MADDDAAPTGDPTASVADAHKKWGHAKKAVAVTNFRGHSEHISSWGHAKKAVRKENRARAKLLAAVEAKRLYVPWDPETAKVDFILVYKPLKKSVGGVDKVERDPRPMDEQDKIAADDENSAGHKQAQMRIEYINTLRINGLEVEIENFVSKFTEYRVIKIYGSSSSMDIWAEKFLMMKPVRPPFASLVDDWKTDREAHHHLLENTERYIHDHGTADGIGESESESELRSAKEINGEVPVRCAIDEPDQPGPSVPEVGAAAPPDSGTTELTDPDSNPTQSDPDQQAPKTQRLYPTLGTFMDETPANSWDRVRSIRAVLNTKSEAPAADKLIAMYNETLYQMPKSKGKEQRDESQFFDANQYVPQTLKNAANSVKTAIGKFQKRYSSVDVRVPDEEADEEAAPEDTDDPQQEIGNKYKDQSDAFKQMIFQNERYDSLWSTKILDWVFNILHGNDRRLTLAKDTFVKRAIRAPFTCAKKDKFLGSNETEFYNSSERSLMVFRILENPEEKSKEDQEQDKKNLKLRDMYRAECFEEGFPLHLGSYKMKLDGAKWSDIYLGQIDNPRKLLRYFWSSSHMKWKYQPLNIVRNYFGSVTAMYFAYFGYYNFCLLIPAIVGAGVFAYGIFYTFTSDFVDQVCNSGTDFLMCADCYIEGTCVATYLSDYCITTRITSVANNRAVVWFSVMMMIWMAVFVTFWKRNQHTIAHQWGTTNSRSASAELRVKYVMTKTSTFRFNRMTGKREGHITFWNRLPQYAIAFTVVALFLSLTLLLTLTITIYNYTLNVSLQKARNTNSFTRKYANEIANVITGSISGTVIVCLSYGYRIIANKLTDLENHRTQRDHDNQLCFKIYLFEFVNYYGTLIYIAFFKGSITSPSNPQYFLDGDALKIEGCAPGGCMSEVSMQMIIIMSLKQFVPIFKDIVRTLNLNRLQEQIKKLILKPFIAIETVKKWRERAIENLKDIDGTRAQYIQDFELREPTEMYQEYVNNIIQLGFLTMFAAALPIAPLICVFINFWQLRQDATRYVKRVRRPIGFRSEGIGTWMNILQVLARIAILVNALLIAFTFDFIPNELYMSKMNKNITGFTKGGYVDFMLATHKLNDTHACRYWSYFQAASDEHSDFWKELWIWRLLFIFAFQNIISYTVSFISLICDSTPKSVRERMVLEEKIAQEWLSSESEDSDAEEEVSEPKVKQRKKKAGSSRRNSKEDTDV